MPNTLFIIREMLPPIVAFGALRRLRVRGVVAKSKLEEEKRIIDPQEGLGDQSSGVKVR